MVLQRARSYCRAWAWEAAWSGPAARTNGRTPASSPQCPPHRNRHGSKPCVEAGLRTREWRRDRHRPRRLPMQMHSGGEPRLGLAYRCGGSAGMAASAASPASRFNPLAGRRRVTSKRAQCTTVARRLGRCMRGWGCCRSGFSRDRVLGRPRRFQIAAEAAPTTARNSPEKRTATVSPGPGAPARCRRTARWW